MLFRIAQRVAWRFKMKSAAPLKDISKLKYQAVFMMGAGGSGKGFAGHRWLKYMPGGGGGGASRGEFEEMSEGSLSEQERSLSNLRFQAVLKKIQDMGIEVELADPGRARIPFRLYEYDERGVNHLIPPSKWETTLPPHILKEVKSLEEIVFGAPVHEIPSYWRQVNPDLYKEELAGYDPKSPGYVHEMSLDMSKAYFQAVLDSGDPLFVDGTGSNLRKMTSWLGQAKKAGYRTSLVLVIVPLTVNQIRNATRSRNVLPSIVVKQWKSIRKNYADLRSKADVSHVIINRNDMADIKMYRKYKDKINGLIRKTSEFDNLYELIQYHQPEELGDWGPLLKPDAKDSGPLIKRLDLLMAAQDRNSDPRVRATQTIKQKVLKGNNPSDREQAYLSEAFKDYRV